MPLFVHEVMRMALGRAAADAPRGRTFVEAGAGESSVCTVMRQLAAGILGDGCSGTKGVWRGQRGEPLEAFYARAATIDPAAQARYERCYAALGPQAREVADAVIADGFGDGLAQVDVGQTAFTLTLPQRLALRLADAAKVKRWLAHVADRDSGPMLSGTTELGEKRLAAAAGAWWAA